MIIHLIWTHLKQTHSSSKIFTVLPVTIGRSLENDLLLNDYEGGISRFHACIERNKNTPILRDCGSTNGIYTNRRRVNELALLPGRRFLLGNYLFAVEWLVQCQKESCQRLIDAQETVCPWCGQFLADAVTQLQFEQQPTLRNDKNEHSI